MYNIDDVDYNNLGYTQKTTEIIDLHDALDCLNDEDKTLIILRYFEDLKFKDIAEITDSNINTVKTRIYKILSMLKIHLECEVDEHE
jgi:RNA polymerase sigma-70 factor (ECF subfamily)